MKIRVLGLIVFVAICFLAMWLNTVQLEYSSKLSEKLPIIMGYLILTSLFVERAIEMFLSAWRSEEADSKDLAIAHVKLKLESVDHKKSDELLSKLEFLEKDRMEYSAKSRAYAIWAGMIIGAIISLVGVRTLSGIVNSAGLVDIQLQLFTIVDVMLTAVVLAGGSDAINKITKVYNSFAVSTSNKLKRG